MSSLDIRLQCLYILIFQLLNANSIQATHNSYKFSWKDPNHLKLSVLLYKNVTEFLSSTRRF